MNEAILAAFREATAEERRLIVLRVAEFPAELAVLLCDLALRDEDWRVRKAAVSCARSVDRSLLAPVLGRALGERDDVAYRNAAASALASLGHAAIPVAKAAFAELDADGRKLAVEALAQIGEGDAVGLLAARLRDDDANVRIAAAEALSRASISGVSARELAERELVRALEDARQTKDSALALAALGSLDALHAELDLGLLGPWLDDAITYRRALSLVARTPEPRAWEVLFEALISNARAVVEVAASILAARLASRGDGDPAFDSLGQKLRALPAALAGLRALADDVDAKERGEAIFLLGIANEPEDVGRATNALSDFRVAEWAERALTRFDAAVVGRLLDAAGDEGSPVREASLSLLPDAGRLPDEALRSGDPMVVSAALLAISRAPRSAGIATLLPFLARSERSVFDAARAAVIASANEDPKAATAALERVGEGSIAELVLASSGVVDPLEVPRLARTLERMLGAEDARIRQVVVGALAVSKSPRARELLRFTLADEAPEVSDAAVRALGTQGASEELAELVRRESSPARAAKALVALSRADFEAAVAAAEDLVLHTEAELAAAAVEILGQARELGRVSKALTRALSHTDPEVVRQALVACSRARESETGVSLLARGLLHPRSDVRKLAVFLLAPKGDTAKILLRAHLEGEVETDPGVKEAIVEALVGAT